MKKYFEFWRKKIILKTSYHLRFMRKNKMVEYYKVKYDYSMKQK